MYNLFGVFSFAEYALFAPIKKLTDVGIDSINFANGGTNNENYLNYKQNYKKFF